MCPPLLRWAMSPWLRPTAESLPCGFGTSHLPVLRALENGEALSQRELARQASVEQPTMAEMLGRMERDGVVQRESNPDDKRATLSSLTRRARTRFPKAKEVLTEAQGAAMAGLSESERKTLRKLLQRVVANLDALGKGEAP